MICTLKYGKYSVNGIHICNRQYIIDKMCLVGTTEVEDSTNDNNNESENKRSISNITLHVFYLFFYLG